MFIFREGGYFLKWSIRGYSARMGYLFRLEVYERAGISRVEELGKLPLGVRKGLTADPPLYNHLKRLFCLSFLIKIRIRVEKRSRILILGV